jgi:quercetin dioxygenase-like cupin family protein
MSDVHTPFVSPVSAIPASPVKGGTAAEMQMLVGPDRGAPNFALRRFIMGAGGGMPFHTNKVEHEQYVLRGRARIRIGDETHEVGPDHTLYIPAGVPHSYEVLEAPFEFLCVVPNRPDEIHVVESC